ncbi:AAC(3) family N-acetyltransferase [Myxococcota bacterium]
MDLAKQLCDLGVTAGAVVMVHASMRKVGARADGLLDALQEVLGPDGTLVMLLGAEPNVPFMATGTPVDVEDMGVLAEVFRTRPGVHVNDHAANRYAALGPEGVILLDDSPLHDYHGPGSVLHRLTDRGAHILRLGANIDTVTLTHYAEYLAHVPNKKRVRRRYVRADIGEQWIDSLDDNEGIVQGQHGEYFSEIMIDYLAHGHARVGPVGRCTAELLHAPHFVQFAVAWMERELK